MDIFSLPSIWNLVVSTIVFSIAAKYIHAHLCRRGVPEGRKRNLWVLGLASVLSWSAGEAADWTHEKIEAGKPVMQNPADQSPLLKAIDQIQK
jgi:hypothetical protein